MSEPIWHEEFDDDDNSIWEARSPYHVDDDPLDWRLKQRLVANQIQWYEAHDSELIGQEGADFWWSLEEAKAAVVKAHKTILEYETEQCGREEQP